MPYAHRKTKLPPNRDRRHKITNDVAEEIKRLHREGVAIREIARRYKDISRRSIQFVIYPERRALVAKQAKEREQHKKSYARLRGAKWAGIMREHRRYKEKIIKGKI